jgi:hypothetical protein
LAGSLCERILTSREALTGSFAALRLDGKAAWLQNRMYE